MRKRLAYIALDEMRFDGKLLCPRYEKQGYEKQVAAFLIVDGREWVAPVSSEPGTLVTRPVFMWKCDPCLKLEAEGRLPGLTRASKLALAPNNWTNDEIAANLELAARCGVVKVSETPVWSVYRLSPPVELVCGFNNRHRLAVFDSSQPSLGLDVACRWCRTSHTFSRDASGRVTSSIVEKKAAT
jgi:hypothetical protein